MKLRPNAVLLLACALVGCAAGASETDAGAPSAPIDATSADDHVVSSEARGGSDGASIVLPPADGSGSRDDSATVHGDASDLEVGVTDGHAGDTISPLVDATLHDGAVDASIQDARGDARSDAVSPACTVGHLLVSQIQSRGAAGASDEFVELYNPTSAPVVLDSTWVVDARSNTAASFTSRWKGAGQSIPSFGHYLVAGTAYASTPAADSALTDGITDASSVRLTHAGVTVDVVCYAYSTSTSTTLTGDTTYDCPGTPAVNPHDDATSTDVSASIERDPGGAAGNCIDTDDSSHDFHTDTPSVPRDSMSAPTP